MCFGFFGYISATILPYVTGLPFGTFPFGINKKYLVTDGIRVTTHCSSCLISFANEFYQIYFFGILIKCMHSIDASVVGSMTTLSWFFPEYFSLTLQCVLYWITLSSYNAFLLCLAVSHIYFLCNVHDSVVVFFL